MNPYLREPYRELTKGSLTVRYIVIGFVMFVLGFLCGSGNCVSNAYADTAGDRNTERMADSQEDQAKSLRQIAKELKEIKKSVKK